MKLLSSLCNIRSAELAFLVTEFDRARSLEDSIVGDSTVDEIESELNHNLIK